MAVVRILKNLYKGWRVGDHVEVTGNQLEAMVAEDGCIVVTPDVPSVPSAIEEMVEPVVKKIKKSRKAVK